MQNDVSKEVPLKIKLDLMELAVGAAQDEGVSLRLGEDALLGQIDELLGSLHKSLSKMGDHKKKEEIKQGAALEYAACIVDLIERTGIAKGKWFYHHKTIGLNTFPYVINNETIIFPYAWALKRIESPGSDSVYDKFMQLIK